MWYWRRLLRAPWTARRSNQSILKAITPEYSLERLMLKQKLQYFGHLMQRADSLEKTLMLGRIEGGRRRGRQRTRWLDGITEWTWVWANSGSWWWTGKPDVQSMGSQRVGHDWVTELNNSWYIYNLYVHMYILDMHIFISDIYAYLRELSMFDLFIFFLQMGSFLLRNWDLYTGFCWWLCGQVAAFSISFPCWTAW